MAGACWRGGPGAEAPFPPARRFPGLKAGTFAIVLLARDTLRAGPKPSVMWVGYGRTE